MTDPTTARAFLEPEVEMLESFDFVAAVPGGNPLHAVEAVRRQDGALEVRMPGRPMPLPALPSEVRSKLRDRGFASEDPADQTKPWTREVHDAAEAVEMLQELLTGILGEKPDATLNVVHGNHEAEYLMREKLAETRRIVEATLTDMLEGPVERDDDGDYVVPVGNVHVMVSPRPIVDGNIVVRVFSITNVGVTVSPELGLFLARLNFGLMFGRFALDTDNGAVWFDESLLGGQLSDELLRFTVKVVATTADEWDDRLKQMFGGATYQDVLKKRATGTVPTTKPGQGGYL
ncbi:MAG: YbjN domain-containing protein [Deltaproteobacteria bacterium]|nr:YbjN domain-containing protein [Deltaproteobacteria bacterium]MBW2361773.1 YbjN domain-containing protein [Deltaproteobacteria bacterium]